MTRRLTCALLLVILAVMAPASGVGAHASLRATTPAADEVVTAGPAEVVLEFTERVDAALGGVQVLGPDGARVDRGRSVSRAGGTVVAVPLRDDRRGTHTVAWRVVSEDGHTIAGSFVFHVGERTGEAVHASRDAGLASELVGGAGRWLAFVGSLLAVGAVALVVALTVDEVARTRLRRLAARAAAAGAAGAALALVGSIADAAGGSMADAVRLLPDAVTTTRLGVVGAARVGAFVLLAITLASTTAWTRRPGPWLAAAGGPSAVLVITTALAGHAWTTEPRLAALTVDVAHLVAVSVWIGGLASLLVIARSTEEPTPLLRAFSRLALPVVAVVFATGVASSWAQVRSVDALTSTTYGRVLVAKVVGVIVIVGAGYLNRRTLGAASARVLAVVQRAGIELAVAALVVALTAALVDLQPAKDAVERPFAGSLPSAGGAVDITVDPAKVGTNDVHLYFLGGDGLPRDVDAAELFVSVGDVPDRKVALQPVTANHFSAYGVALGAPGRWRFTIVAVRTGESETVTFEVPVR